MAEASHHRPQFRSLIEKWRADRAAYDRYHADHINEIIARADVPMRCLRELRKTLNADLDALAAEPIGANEQAAEMLEIAMDHGGPSGCPHAYRLVNEVLRYLRN